MHNGNYPLRIVHALVKGVHRKVDVETLMRWEEKTCHRSSRNLGQEKSKVVALGTPVARVLLQPPIQRLVLVVSLAVLLILILPVVPASSQSPTKPGIPSNVSVSSENLKITVTWQATTETGVAETTDYYIDWIDTEVSSTDYDNIFLNPTDTSYEITSYFGSPLIEGHEISVCVFGYNSATSEVNEGFACANVIVVGAGIEVSEVSVLARRGTSVDLLVSLDNPDLLSTTVRMRHRTAAVDGGQAGPWSDETESQPKPEISSSFISVV